MSMVVIMGVMIMVVMRIMKWMVTTTDMWTTPLSAKIFTMLMLPVVVDMP